MAKVLLASPHKSDLATVTAGSEATSMPATNLFREQPTDVWRATDLDSAYLVIDRTDCADGGPRLLWLGYHNGSSAGTLRVRAASTKAGLTDGSAAVDMTVDLQAHANFASWDRVHTAVWLGDTQQDYAWWRIDISDADNANGYFQAGRLYLVDPYTPTLNIKYGWAPAYSDPSTIDTVQGGASFAADFAARRAFRVTFIAAGDNAETEFFDNLYAFNRYRGAKKDVLLIIDRANDARMMDWSVYGRMTDLQPLTNDSFHLWEQPYTVTEWEHP